MIDSLSKGERTSQAILEAAYTLFIEQGYHATSMRQIAQRAGISLAGIYTHFSGKEQIFDKVLIEKHPYRQVLQVLQSTPGETVEEFVHNAARAVIAELGKRPDFLRLAFIEFIEFEGKHAPLLFQTIFPHFLPLWQRFASPPNRLRELPPQAIFLSFLGMFFAYYVTSAIFHSHDAESKTPLSIDQYVDIFMHGILR